MILNDYEVGVVLDLLDVATEGNMPRVRSGMIEERGYKPAHIIEVTDKLTKAVGRDSSFELGDFQ